MLILVDDTGIEALGPYRDSSYRTRHIDDRQMQSRTSASFLNARHRLCLAVASLALARACTVCAQQDTDWPAYHGGFDNGHYSHLDQVHRGNVADLEIAWTLDTGELLWGTVLPAAGHATPITYRIDGRQYIVIAAGGGKATTRSGIDDAGSGATYVAFALPQTLPDFASQ